jgi:hypothetical protein
VNDWTHFTQAEAASWDPVLVAPGASQAGLSHFPPTAIFNYNWGTVNLAFGGSIWRSYDGDWSVQDGQYHAEPTHDIMERVRELDHYVRQRGFVCLRIEPFMWREVPTFRLYYPLYAKACELGVTFQTQVGDTGPLYPSRTGQPMYIDEVALDFPDLRIMCGHVGMPWTEEMLGVAFKHKNVWIDTSARVPKHWPEAFVKFVKSWGRDKVCFATDYPLLQWDRVLKEVDGLGLSEEVQRKFLYENAVKAFQLKV